MTSIDLQTIREELEQLLRTHGFEPNALVLVPSVQRWAHEHGLPENNALRQATAFPTQGRIVMASSLSEMDARSSSSILRIGPEAHERLARDLRLYARFLLLHEIAHLRGSFTEEEADAWAIEQLDRSS